MRKEEYEKWVEKAFQYITNVYPIVRELKNVSVGSTQYIPKLEGDFELVFLGHDAHEGIADDKHMDISNAQERFFKGNGDPKCWRMLPEWKIWNNIESAFRKIGFTEIMDNGYISEEILNKTIVTNALLFNYSGKAEELNAKLKPQIVNDCIKLAGELVFDVIKPKLVICSSCDLVFVPLIKNYNPTLYYEVFRLDGTRRKVMRCRMDNGVTVLGIPHTSYPVPLPVAAFVRDAYLGEDIGYTMSNLASIPNDSLSYKHSIDVLHIIELVTTSKDFQLDKIENTSERYSLSDHLLLTITKSGKGYLGIRHKNFNGKFQYPNSKYEFTERYRYLLKEKGWNCDSPVWIATKLIKDYGCDEDEIAKKVISELDDIIKLVRQ